MGETAGDVRGGATVSRDVGFKRATAPVNVAICELALAIAVVAFASTTAGGAILLVSI